MPEQKNSVIGIRVIAIFEAVKAVFLLVVGFGLLSLINQDTEAFAVYLVKHLHLNPVHKYPRIFIDTVSHVSSTEMWLLASLALFDAVIRGAEAIGLWMGRDWGKWLGIITAALYLPIEIYEMWKHLTWLKTLAFVTNVLIVIYLSYTLRPAKPRPE